MEKLKGQTQECLDMSLSTFAGDVVLAGEKEGSNEFILIVGFGFGLYRENVLVIRYLFNNSLTSVTNLTRLSVDVRSTYTQAETAWMTSLGTSDEQ